jgi:hypothetical protein
MNIAAIASYSVERVGATVILLVGIAEGGI